MSITKNHESHYVAVLDNPLRQSEMTKLHSRVKYLQFLNAHSQTSCISYQDTSYGGQNDFKMALNLKKKLIAS